MRLPRHAEIWLPGYIRSRWRDWLRPQAGPLRFWVALCDHFEPLWNKPDDETAEGRVALWRKMWPEIAGKHSDSSGRSPKYTFFFPQEEYRREFLDPLQEVTEQGIADVEVHIHHDGEGEQNFVDRMQGFLEVLRRNHGLLHVEGGRTVFGFIHGNWALDNSRPDGRWCGLNHEIRLLSQLGCYADFTMPSGASPTQARTINTIYWVTDDPLRPKSYDSGVALRIRGPREGELLMIPGPVAIRWTERVVPRMETGEVAWQDPPSPYRVRRWMEVAPTLGRDCFIKLYTHGAQERNSKALLQDGALDRLFTLIHEAVDRQGGTWYGVSAWEMYRAVEAIREGRDPVVACGRA